jgi:hypothetical protein
MLTEGEKIRIRNEEVFRTEVCRELEAKKPRSLWTLLNSSFALWFLSSVVLASLTTVFTYYQAKRAEQGRKIEIERRFETEINSRISLALRGAHFDQSRIAHGKEYSPESIYITAQSYLDNSFTTSSSSLQDFSVYPEYKGRTFRSLVSELRSVVNRARQSDLTNALEEYEKLLDLGSQQNGNEKATQQTVQSLVEHLGRLARAVGYPGYEVTSARF